MNHRPSSESSSRLDLQSPVPVSKLNDVTRDIVTAFASASIPLGKLRHPKIRQMFAKMGCPIPTAKSTYLDKFAEMSSKEQQRIISLLSEVASLPVMSRSRVAKRTLTNASKCCSSPAKKGKISERNNDPLLNAELSLPAGIKFPKKESTKRYSHIEIVGNRFEKEIKPIIDRSFKLKNSNLFEPKECRDLVNSSFESEYAAKRNELRQEGTLSKEATSDQFGFLFAGNENRVRDWCENGIRSGNAKASRLGKPNDGVSLAQYVDIVCPTNLLPQEGWICIVKYFKGRVYHVQETGEPLEPQPNFDCHVPTSKSNSSWNRGNTDTFYSNQIYLYEYSDESVPTTRPRQVLPFAAIKYRFKRSVELQKPDVTRYSKVSKKKRPEKKSAVKDDNERLNVQRQREERAMAVKPILQNRQHPGVPLMCVKPKPPPLMSKSFRKAVPNTLGQRTPPTTSPSAAAEAVMGTSLKEINRRLSTENAVPDNLHSMKINHIQKTNAFGKPENKKLNISAIEQTSQSFEKQSDERPQLQSFPVATNHQHSHQQQQGIAKVAAEQKLQQRTERPNKSIGTRHHSSGLTMSSLKLKAGDHFQAKMDLVSYADTLVYPLAVLSPKLSIRKFISMNRLRSVEFSNTEVSIKKEFFCPGCNRYASYFRLYVRQNRIGPDCAVDFKNLCDFMQQRERVGFVHFPNESQEMLMFPESDFSKSIGIPQLENASSSNPWFLHCLLLSKEPKMNYYQRMLFKAGDAQEQLVDEVLTAHIWADAGMPAYDEEDAALRDSYGGEFPCEEAVKQVFKGENSIQHQILLQSVGRGKAKSDTYTYQKIDFNRRCEIPPDHNVSMDNITFTTEMLKTWLDTVAAQEHERRRLSAQSETEESEGKNLSPPPASPYQLQLTPEPKSVTYAKRVFEEPPESPVKAPTAVTTERAILAEMNPHSKDKSGEKSRDIGRQSSIAEAVNVQPQQNGSNQHDPNSGEKYATSAGMLTNVTPDLTTTNSNGGLQHCKTGSPHSTPASNINELFTYIRNSILTDNRRPSTFENGNVIDKIKDSLNGSLNSESQAFNAYEMQNRAAQEARELVRKPEPCSNPKPPTPHVSVQKEDPKPDLQWSYCPGAEFVSDSHQTEVTEDEIHQVLELSLQRRISEEDGSESPATLSSSPPRPFRRDHRFLRKNAVKQNSPSFSSDQDLSPPLSPLKNSTCDVGVGPDFDRCANRMHNNTVRRPAVISQAGLYSPPFLSPEKKTIMRGTDNLMMAERLDRG